MSDARLAALEALYRGRFAVFLRVATGIVRDEDRALDAVQEGFAAAIRERRRFRDEGPLEAWVWRMVVNAALRQFRGEPPTALEPSLNGSAPVEHRDVRAGVAALPERQRTVLFLRYFADLDYRTIGDVLGISPGRWGQRCRVDIHAVDGTHRAVLGGNAYLFVENEPNTGDRVLSISAVGVDGRRATIPLATTFGPIGIAPQIASSRAARGPTRVQAKIAHPTIAWFFRHEPRGVALSKAKLTPEQRGFLEAHEFPNGPLEVTLTGNSDQFLALAGAAADGVKSVTIFLADGQRQQAALRDNLFTALVGSSQFPIRAVAYDARDRVVGIHESGVPSVISAAGGSTSAQDSHRTGACSSSRPARGRRSTSCSRPAMTSSSSITCARRWSACNSSSRTGTSSGRAPSRDSSSLRIPRAHLSSKRQLAFAVGYSREG